MPASADVCRRRIARRRDFLRAAAAWALPGALHAQRPEGHPARVGILGATSEISYRTRWDAFRAGLREKGYVVGRNLQYAERWANGQTAALHGLARELVALGVDVIVTHGIPGTRAAQQAAGNTPIVMAIVTDPVSAGLVKAFARPGGNTTGSAWFAPELAAKRLDLVRELKPRAAQIGVLTNPGNAAFTDSMLSAMQEAGGRQGLRLRPFGADGQAALEGAVAAMAQARVDGMVVLEEAVLNSYPAEIAALAVRHRLLSVGNREFAEAGGLVGYGADLHALFHRAAFFVDRILRGTPAGDLPIEQASEFELVVNAATARTLAVAVPQSMVLRAAKVIG